LLTGDRELFIGVTTTLDEDLCARRGRQRQSEGRCETNE
jgi:hypothetical protein